MYYYTSIILCCHDIHVQNKEWEELSFNKTTCDVINAISSTKIDDRELAVGYRYKNIQSYIFLISMQAQVLHRTERRKNTNSFNKQLLFR